MQSYCNDLAHVQHLDQFQVCNGVEISVAQSQYMELGDLFAACLTNPTSCGNDGGSLSFWLKYHNVYSYTPIISTTPREDAGFEIGISVHDLE